jgi:hypothetical protein
LRLPGGEAALIDQRKVVEYLLSPVHPIGRHKARVFLRALGLSADEAEVLIAALREAARGADAELTSEDGFGRRYQIDFQVRHGGKTALVRSAWLSPGDGKAPVFLTAFVL